MTGNEILLNMKNYEYFRQGELVNAFYELSKRVNLKENEDLGKKEWTRHPYVAPLYRKLIRKMFTYNVRNFLKKFI
jgi:hypothetical protein